MERDGRATVRNGLVPLLVIAAVLGTAYLGWEALGRRPRPEPFGPWSDAHQIAPDPPALPSAVGESGPIQLDDGDEDLDDEAR